MLRHLLIEHCLVEVVAGIAPHMRRKRQSAFASIWDNSNKLGSFCKKDQTLLHFKIVLLPYSISDNFLDSPVPPRGSAGFVAIELVQLW